MRSLLCHRVKLEPSSALPQYGAIWPHCSRDEIRSTRKIINSPLGGCKPKADTESAFGSSQCFQQKRDYGHWHCPYWKLHCATQPACPGWPKGGQLSKHTE